MFSVLYIKQFFFWTIPKTNSDRNMVNQTTRSNDRQPTSLRVTYTLRTLAINSTIYTFPKSGNLIKLRYQLRDWFKSSDKHQRSQTSDMISIKIWTVIRNSKILFENIKEGEIFNNLDYSSRHYKKRKFC